MAQNDKPPSLTLLPEGALTLTLSRRELPHPPFPHPCIGQMPLYISSANPIPPACKESSGLMFLS